MSTIVAPLTPIQRSAVILLRASGPEVKNLFSLFNVKPEPKVATLCRYMSVSRPAVQDDILLTYFKAPNSYTGEDLLELSFHGNPLIVRAAVDDMLAMGVRIAEAGEFTKRAYLNGKITLSQAEAVDALIRANSEAGISAAKSALNGALDGVFYEARGELIKLAAELEAFIDFSEDKPELFGAVEAVVKKLKDLADSYRSVRLAVDGARVVIAGAPNAGKSTLFNLLVGWDRAIVSEEAGTTRDILSETVNIYGVTFALADTAGVREGETEAERAGTLRAMAAIDSADIVLALVDASETLSPEAARLLERTEGMNRIVAGSKCDISRGNGLSFRADILISATANTNIDELKGLLARKAEELFPAGRSEAALLTARQMHECLECIKELSELSEEQTADIQAYHIRSAVRALDRVRGVSAGEETLDEIFSRFCIGK